MLRELSKLYPHVWARVRDTDGEFLLVEAAKAVPKWLNPERDANRIWIHNGQLKVIPIDAVHTSDLPSSSLTLAEAVEIIKTAPGSLLHIPALEDEAFCRLRKYPGHLETSTHHSRLIIPRKIAYILHDRPRAVAPAIEAFTVRDPIKTRRLFDYKTPDAQLRFPHTDLVFVSVKFTRVLYAQLMAQRFTPPKDWPAAYSTFAQTLLQPGKGKGKANEDTFGSEKIQTAVSLGMKLACGFELMVTPSETRNSRIVREVELILDDLAEDNNDEAALPSDDTIRTWKDVERQDSESWLDINFEDFERELDSGRRRDEGSFSHPADSGFGDAGVHTDLRRIVSQFQAFLNDDEAGIEGAEYDDMDVDDDDDDESDTDEDDSGEDDGVDFDEEKFSRLMREMMGLPPSNVGSKPKAPAAEKAEVDLQRGKAGISTPGRMGRTDGREGRDKDEDGILQLAAQFEAELKGHGALRLEPPKTGKQAGGSDIQQIVSAGGAGASAPVSDVDSDDEVDVDLNLARNLLESFKGQQGMSGPAGNILSMLGLTLPRDDDDDEDDDKDFIEKGK